ncbi:MAG: hypothetical protein E7652_04220 [Ruminococcaceae bacterium]|nr:hypothetical protein [Oscillospiraceae bacterium]
MTLILELINQRSLINTIKFVFLTPHIFLINFLIVAFTYGFVLFFKRRLFIYVITTFIWTIVGAINLILLITRNTQFYATDILVFRYGMFITMRYLNIIYVALMFIALVALIFGLVVLYKRGYKTNERINYFTSSIVLTATVILCTVLIVVGNIIGFLDSRFTDINEGYTNNGFVYSYGCSLFVQGVEEPVDNSDKLLNKLIDTLDKPIVQTKDRPNVVFVQLESFIDPEEIKELELDTSAAPNFQRIQNEFPSGYLHVPVVGGGTANTEFEILTGMNLDHFGTVEIPYESVLTEKTCESMAYNYKALGYKAHAIHDFSAGFYKRNTVYSNLGFDTFTSFEYMTDLEYNDIGWAKDSILERYILSALNSTKESDFVYAVSVQGHGSYPNDFDDTENDISTTVPEPISEYTAALEYYISQIREMDEFVGSLTDTLSDYDEKTVVVFYGDHLPAFNISSDLMKSGSLYETEYTVWANYDIGSETKDLKTYQLAAYVQELIGFSSGKVTQLHQIYREDKDYELYLQTLEYDIVEGDAVIYGNKGHFEPSELKMGIEDITVAEYDYDRETKLLTVKGDNFNEFSLVYINGSRKSTVFVDKNTLVVENVRLRNDNEISVAQKDMQMPWTYLTMTDSLIAENIVDRRGNK